MTEKTFLFGSDVIKNKNLASILRLTEFRQPINVFYTSANDYIAGRQRSFINLNYLNRKYYNWWQITVGKKKNWHITHRQTYFLNISVNFALKKCPLEKKNWTRVNSTIDMQWRVGKKVKLYLMVFRCDGFLGFCN